MNAQHPRTQQSIAQDSQFRQQPSAGQQSIPLHQAGDLPTDPPPSAMQPSIQPNADAAQQQSLAQKPHKDSQSGASKSGLGLNQQEQWELVDNSSRQQELVDRFGGQNASSNQSELVDSIGEHSEVVDSMTGQSGMAHSLGGQSEVVDKVSRQQGRQGQGSQQMPNQDTRPHDHEQAAERQILDARGCAFGLSEMMCKTPPGVEVCAKTVVEAFEVPWALVQVTITLLPCVHPICSIVYFVAEPDFRPCTALAACFSGMHAACVETMTHRM